MKQTQSLLKSSRIPVKIISRLRIIAHRADALRIPAYIVGGFVRDLLLRRIVWDIDIVTEKDPGKLAACIKGKITQYPQFMTYSVLLEDGSHIDFATTRKETYPVPAALPRVSAGSLIDDLARRDFTCNALAVGLNRKNFGLLIDPFQGKKDLDSKILKIFHMQSFIDDPTRIFRAVRFMARYHMCLEPLTGQCLKHAVRLGFIDKLSRHRIAQEFKKILMEENPQKAFELLASWKLLTKIHPMLKHHIWKHLPLTKRSLLFSVAWFLQNDHAINIERILVDCAWDRSFVDRVISFVNAVHSLRKKGKNTDQMLDDFCNEDIYNLEFLKYIPGINHTVMNRLKKYRMHSKALLNGADLHSIGFLPGKIYGTILREVQRNVWEGKLTSRADSIAYVREHYRGVTL